MSATSFQRRRRELEKQVSVVADMTVMEAEQGPSPAEETAEKPAPKRRRRQAETQAPAATDEA